MMILFITALRIALLAVPLVVTPLLFVTACSASDASWPKRLSNAGLLSVSLSLLVALGLHLSRIPITAMSLLTTHACLFVLAVATAVFRIPHFYQAEGMAAFRIPHSDLRIPHSAFRIRPTVYCPLFILLLLLLPWTHFTGIDTYKWQDLATSVRMEQSLPWLVHPLSLLGFTPRAYPPAHPILLATVQIVGGLGVDGGFVVVSILVALIGVFSATRLAMCLMPNRLAYAVGLLYVFSPVFVRYAHWATGRGLFLAIFPAFVALLIEPRGPGKTTQSSVQKRGDVALREESVNENGDESGKRLEDSPLVIHSRRRSRQPKRAVGGLRSDHHVMSLLAWIRRLVTAALVAVLLLLTHKVALVAIPLVLLAAIGAGCLPFRRLSVSVRVALCLPFLLVAAAMVTPAFLPGVAGIPGGLLRTGVVRFGWMLPFALIGLWLPSSESTGRLPYASRLLFLAALPAIALAFERQMYGALYALPFVCLFAVSGFSALLRLLPKSYTRWVIGIAVALTLGGTLVTVVSRSMLACSKPLYRAAMFLEAHDPEGPFMVHAPGLARSRVQAYVSGCARFDVRAADSARPQWPSHFPWWRGNLRATVDAWAAVLRGLVTLDNTAVDWYGNPRAHYYFVIDGEGERPIDAVRIYDREGIAIFQRNALP